MLRTLAPALALIVGSASLAQAQAVAYGVITNVQGVQQLVRFSPGSAVSVTTLGATGAMLTGIDFRPSNNTLYGYDGNLLYTINVNTGAATVSADLANTTGNAGFDFNPAADRLRITDASGFNLRYNPFDGVTTTDGTYSFVAGDPNAGRAPSITAVAYTNSDTDPMTGTTLYAIDASLGQLLLVNTPNGGVGSVTTVGNLGIGAFSSVTGFDILTVGGMNTAYFAASTSPTSGSQLYTLNLTTGAATLVGAIGGVGTPSVQGLALTTVPEPSTYVLLAAGLAGIGVMARRRRHLA